MRKIILMTMGLFIVSTANAQLLNIVCEDCRDFVGFPEDARNFAYNQVFGDNSWLSLDQGDIFQVTNMLGQTVTADLNWNVTWIAIPWVPIPVPILGPIQVIIVFPNADRIVYTIDPATISGPLPVGDVNTPFNSDSDGGGGGGGGSGDDDDYDDFEDNDDYGDDYDSDDDGDCAACEAYFDGDENGELDEDPYDWLEEEL
jgi:hypothetical protein